MTNAPQLLGLHLVVVCVAFVLVDCQKLSFTLLTRPADGRPLCALDQPNKTLAVGHQNMPGVPPTVLCGMECTKAAAKLGCRQFVQFNYAAASRDEPCELYYYEPKEYSEVSECHHYMLPGSSCIVKIVVTSHSHKLYLTSNSTAAYTKQCCQH